MKIIETRSAFQEWRQSIARDPKTSKLEMGYIPTMGALHDGHASLVRQARKENDWVVLSAFVNPTQFNNPDDFNTYPKTFEADLALGKTNGADVFFAPRSMEELYPEGYRYQVHEKEFSHLLCGAHREGHFDGVLTVVMKVLNLVKPKRAYFGEKDYQQLSLIRGMVDSFFMDIQIVACPTLREPSGLAMSSRNLLLTPEERQIAPQLYEVISKVKSTEEAKTKLTELGFKIDYLEDREDFNSDRRYVAAYLGKVRLIDNVELK